MQIHFYYIAKFWHGSVTKYIWLLCINLQLAIASLHESIKYDTSKHVTDTYMRRYTSYTGNDIL